MLLVSVCLSHLKAVEICGIGSLTDKGLIRLHPSGNSSDNYVAGIHAMANWNKITPLKVNIMVSSARLGRLPNRINLIKCGMKNISMFYPFCNEHEETEFHIFFSACEIALEVRAEFHKCCNAIPTSSPNLDSLFKYIKGRIQQSSKQHASCSLTWS